jgi:hypothetical protein
MCVIITIRVSPALILVHMCPDMCSAGLGEAARQYPYHQAYRLPAPVSSYYSMGVLLTSQTTTYLMQCACSAQRATLVHMCPHIAPSPPSTSRCLHTTMHASSYYYICVIILLYICPHVPLCVLILPHMCFHTTRPRRSGSAPIYSYVCPHTPMCPRMCGDRGGEQDEGAERPLLPPLTYPHLSSPILTYPHLSSRMLTYADVSSPILTYPHLSSRILTYADVC